MADDRFSFDVTNLDGLAKIKSEQQQLRDLATRAAEHRDKVAEVYTRVVRDYETRIAGLEDQAQRLRVQARNDFARLDAVWEEVRQAMEQARFDLQESEFRREIGEFSAEEFQRRQKTIEAAIADRQRELERIGQLRARFLELLPMEGAAPPPVVPLPPARPIVSAPASPAASAATYSPPVTAAVPVAMPAPVVVPAVAPAPAPMPAVAPVAAVAQKAASGIGETMVLPPPGTEEFQLPPPPADGAPTQVVSTPGAIGDAPEPFATIAVPSGVIVEERPGGDPVRHRLATLTTIGRTPDNHIVVPSREASRKHAEIVLTPKGYQLRDLGSPNGTYVNGSKVTEHPLKDGDTIVLAGRTFVFRAK